MAERDDRESGTLEALLPENPTANPNNNNQPWWKPNLGFTAAATSTNDDINWWNEVSGSLGDMGTFVPLVIALTLVNNLDLGTTLIFTGLYNAITGFLFGVPMPVQPMKSIAAVAISEGDHLTVAQIMAAGICTAGTLFLLGITGLMGLFYRIIPLPVVRGVQLSQGLSFAFTAVKYIRQNQNFSTGKPEGSRAWLGWDGLLVALISLLLLILVTGSGEDTEQQQQQQQEQDHRNRSNRSSSSRRSFSNSWLNHVPGALVVMFVGVLIGILRDPSVISDLKLGPNKIHVLKFTWQDFKIGFFRAAVPQIPLSVLNSVIAVCKLSTDLFPERRMSATAVSASVGVMNLVGCWFGAMPVCHGAGGLAGQYKFGARTGFSVVILGGFKIALGLILGSSLLRILTSFPIGGLGVLLLFAGVELAMASRDMNSKRDSFVMLVCAAVSLTGSSAALGFVCGIVLYLLIMTRDMVASRSLRSSKDPPSLH